MSLLFKPGILRKTIGRRDRSPHGRGASSKVCWFVWRDVCWVQQSVGLILAHKRDVKLTIRCAYGCYECEFDFVLGAVVIEENQLGSDWQGGATIWQRFATAPSLQSDV